MNDAGRAKGTRMITRALARRNATDSGDSGWKKDTTETGSFEDKNRKILKRKRDDAQQLEGLQPFAKSLSEFGWLKKN